MLRKSWLIAAASLWLTLPAMAATVSGTVVDSAGQPVSGVRVQVVGSSRAVQTGSTGRFTFEDLPHADIELHVSGRHFMHRNVHVHGSDKEVWVQLRDTVFEVIDVTALPWHVSQLESAAPVTVLAEDALRARQASTLGDTLKHELGVHSTYNGPVAGSPIIRGQSGPRVLVAQNGLDVGDVSRVGPDHAVAAEASTARQIEILRGPATLFYGSGAIGGVVNVVDDRVPRDTDTFGAWQLEYNSAGREPVVQGSVNIGLESVAIHMDGFWREAGNLRVPFDATEEQREHYPGQLHNSAYDSYGASLGGSYLLPEGFVGLSVGHLVRDYGIPGHSHGDALVSAALEQNRVQFIGELQLHNPLLSEVRGRYGYTDYEHFEREGGIPLTTFSASLHEGKLELFHHPWREWRGAMSLHYRYEDFAAVGEEAFTPPATTESLAVALMEERHFGDWLVQLGVRAEHVSLDAKEALLPSDATPGLEGIRHTYTPLSFSAGMVWDFVDGYNLGLSLTRSQRAPSAAELLSNGPHLAAGSYEVGALYEVTGDEHGDWSVDFAERPLAMETANNVDLSLRKFEGEIGFVAGLFYNRIDDFYYERATAWLAEGHSHDHDHDHEVHSESVHGQEGEQGLPVFAFTAADVDSYGVETEWHWQLAAPVKLVAKADYVRMRLRNGGDLPRVPPLRIGLHLHYDAGPLTASVGATRHFSQSRTADYETVTGGYVWADAELTYQLGRSGDTRVFLRAANLTNEDARAHSSFIKELAPLPARSVTVGLRSRF